MATETTTHWFPMYDRLKIFLHALLFVAGFSLVSIVGWVALQLGWVIVWYLQKINCPDRRGDRYHVRSGNIGNYSDSLVLAQIRVRLIRARRHICNPD